MEDRPLVPVAEWWLTDGAALALLAALLYRVGVGYVRNPLFWQGKWAAFDLSQLWLIDSQLVVACLLLTGIILTGCYLSRGIGQLVTGALGITGWLAALSMLPRSGWPVAPVAVWLKTAVVVALVAAVVVMLDLRRRWRREFQGHGFLWIRRWAVYRPYFSRKLAKSVLRYLGFQE